MTASIALIDDDRNILTSVQMALEAAGFNVETFINGELGLQGLLQRPFDLAVVDIKMPRLDGHELLRRLRKKSNMPIIFLTSTDDDSDEALSLRMGADDYIRKPFKQLLLIERIRAVLRRHQASDDTPQDTIFQRGSLLLDFQRHLCSWKGQAIPLTVTEFLILKALAHRPGHVKSRNQLMDAAYGENFYVDDRTIDSHIKRLRRKFHTFFPDFNNIETLYGIGYRFAENEQ